MSEANNKTGAASTKNNEMTGLKKKLREQRGFAAELEENKQYLALFALIVVALLVILISILALKLPVVSICIMVLLEAGIAACLQNEPIWLHGLLVLVEIIAGILCGKTIFMILLAALYVVGILVLKLLRS